MLTCQRVYHVFLKTGIQYFEPHKNKESVQLVSLCARTLPIRFYHHQAVCTYCFFCKIYSRYILSSSKFDMVFLVWFLHGFFSYLANKRALQPTRPPQRRMGCTPPHVKCAAFSGWNPSGSRLTEWWENRRFLGWFWGFLGWFWWFS